MIKEVRLLLEGFGATLAGMTIDEWLASLSPEDRAALTCLSQKLAGFAPALLAAPVETNQPIDEDRRA